MLEGVGKDAEVVVNERGGKQSKVEYRFDLLPARALAAVAKVLKEGAEKYGEDNWRDIDSKDHLNHALIHAYADLAGDDQDDHLEHAACRILMALEMAIVERERAKSDAGVARALPIIPELAAVLAKRVEKIENDIAQALGCFPSVKSAVAYPPE